MSHELNQNLPGSIITISNVNYGGLMRDDCVILHEKKHRTTVYLGLPKLQS